MAYVVCLKPPFILEILTVNHEACAAENATKFIFEAKLQYDSINIQLKHSLNLTPVLASLEQLQYLCAY